MSRSRLFLALAALAAIAPAPAYAQATEEAVKAAFLPRFARYVAWPAPAAPPAGTPFQLCIIGQNPFGRALEQAAAGELIDGHGVAVRHVPSADRSGGCHLAFVQGAAPGDTARLLLALQRRPVLTVTDARAGPQHGIIHFTVVGGRVRFLIDDAAAADRGISISSRLLALALNVRQRR